MKIFFELIHFSPIVYQRGLYWRRWYQTTVEHEQWRRWGFWEGGGKRIRRRHRDVTWRLEVKRRLWSCRSAGIFLSTVPPDRRTVDRVSEISGGAKHPTPGPVKAATDSERKYSCNYGCLWRGELPWFLIYITCTVQDILIMIMVCLCKPPV